eukprot:9962273-Alexandrium_andersonii.AAC.1
MACSELEDAPATAGEEGGTSAPALGMAVSGAEAKEKPGPKAAGEAREPKGQERARPSSMQGLKPAARSSQSSMAPR